MTGRRIGDPGTAASPGIGARSLRGKGSATERSISFTKTAVADGGFCFFGRPGHRQTLRGFSINDALEIVKGIEPRRMSVPPHRLDRIPADANDALQLETSGRQRFLRISINVPQNVDLPLAPGAGTVSSEAFQRNETFAAIRPFDGEFVADLLNVQRRIHRC